MVALHGDPTGTEKVSVVTDRQEQWQTEKIGWEKLLLDIHCNWVSQQILTRKLECLNMETFRRLYDVLFSFFLF